MSMLALEDHSPYLFSYWTEEVDATQLVRDSERLSAITCFLNLEDLDKGSRFLRFFPIVHDFERLRVQTCEHERVYTAYTLDSCFDNSVWRKMRVLSNQLSPRVNAYVAYCELKSQLCLEKNDFFYEIYLRVESRLKSGCRADVAKKLKDLVWKIKELYDVYL